MMHNNLIPQNVLQSSDPPPYTDICSNNVHTEKSSFAANVIVNRNHGACIQPILNNNHHVVYTMQPNKNAWRHGLCSCRCNIDCCYASCCRICYLIDLGRMHNENCCTMCCCPDFGFIALRTKIRTERNIEGSICGDIWASVCCGACALIQMKKETIENPVRRL